MSSRISKQIIPLIVAIVTFIGVSVIYYFVINILNIFPGEKIQLRLDWADVLIGLTIYLKTAIDFALLIGILMHKFPGVKNRILIEVGTALGNALGTIMVLVIWFFFKEVIWLLALMIFFASLVLLKLAESSIEHIHEDSDKKEITGWVKTAVGGLESFLKPINSFLDPLLSKIVPDLKFDSTKVVGYSSLFISSFSIPFILGMDDFAGYVPLFKVVNVLGFGTGVFLGHMILNILLFLNPEATIKAIKNPVVAILGSVAFIGISAWGLWEVFHLLDHTYFHLFK